MNTEIFSNLSGRKIVLASGSPRRRELLGMLGLKFKVAHVGDVDESYRPDMPADKVAPMLAARKGNHYKATAMSPDEVVIAADTVVIIDNEVLGKPRDAAEAALMLRKLSGRTHKVITGVNVSWAEGSITSAATTNVSFAQLTDEEIKYYIHTYRPLDKAGAYGIQEWIGCIAVKHIDGSYYNVMGLPLHLLYTMLKQI